METQELHFPNLGRAAALHLAQDEVVAALQKTLATAGNSAAPALWVDGDSEILAFPARLQVLLTTGRVLIELPLSTEQTGEASLFVAFALGKQPGDAALRAATEELPRGEPRLAARWGRLVQEALWQALLRAGPAALVLRPATPAVQLRGLFCDGQRLTYLFSTAIPDPLLRAHMRQRRPML